MSQSSSEMPDLLTAVLSAAGGLARFQALKTIELTASVSGLFWALKGYPNRSVLSAFVDVDFAAPRVVFFNLGGHLDSQHAHLKWIWTPAFLSVERPDGTVLASRSDPTAHFASHTLKTQWDDLDLLYFRGYALWNYMTTPFCFAAVPGVVTREVMPPHVENGQIWRVLEVTHPPGFATHCRTQKFYFDAAFKLRRLDYTVDVVPGSSTVAHYVHDEKMVGGISFPTFRRVVVMVDGYGVGSSMITIQFHDIVVREKDEEVRASL